MLWMDVASIQYTMITVIYHSLFAFVPCIAGT